jgi:hypothetical protein
MFRKIIKLKKDINDKYPIVTVYLPLLKGFGFIMFIFYVIQYVYHILNLIAL